MFVFSVCRLVSRRCHNISTMYPLAPAPHRTGRGALHHPAPSLSHPLRMGIKISYPIHPGRLPSILALEAGTQSLRIKEQPHQRGKSLPPKLARPLCETSKSCGHGLNPHCVGPCFPYPFSQTGTPLLHPRYQASSLLWVPPTSVSLRPLPRFLHLSENALIFPAPTDGSPWLPHGLHVRLDAA
mgnify:CR=1 FL=1